MAEPVHFRWVNGDLIVQLRVSPRSSRDEVGSLMGDRLKVALTASPVEGKANRCLIKFVARQFGVAPSQVTIISGVASRDKTVRVHQPAHLPKEFHIAGET